MVTVTTTHITTVVNTNTHGFSKSIRRTSAIHQLPISIVNTFPELNGKYMSVEV
ncbi:hypothetical protein BN903_146 [Halorubrum sp. AJ67]|nr:hypothetical protein BN903_146 [Halorubrum sp. AJ67]